VLVGHGQGHAISSVVAGVAQAASCLIPCLEP
jgi:hypothetical protein